MEVFRNVLIQHYGDLMYKVVVVVVSSFEHIYQRELNIVTFVKVVVILVLLN